MFHGVIFRRDQKAKRFPGFAVLKLDRIGLGESRMVDAVTILRPGY